MKEVLSEETAGDNVTIKLAAEASTLVRISEERDHMLRGLDGEASAVQIQTSFFDRGAMSALEAIQDNFYLVPKIAIVDDEVIAVDTTNLQYRSTAQLSTDYFRFVNN